MIVQGNVSILFQYAYLAGEDEEEVDGVPEEEDAEDIFELEGMSELDINATPEELKRRHAEAAATRGGWEGAVPSVHAHAHGVVDGGQLAAAEASTSGRPAVDETANKLDSMMELAFAHLGRRIEAGEVTRVST